MTGGGGAPRIFHRRRRRRRRHHRPDERALKQRTRWTGAFLVLQVSATSPVISAGPLVPIS